MGHFDVVVIGSGPSGASAAFHLAKNGMSAAIVEKELLPRYKTCGGGFVFRGRKDLPFSIDEVVEREFHVVDIYLGKKLHFKTERKDPIITMIMRDAFDNLIVEKAKELGVTLLQNHKLKSLEHQQDKIVLATSRQTITTKFVIAADGALSPTAKMAGWKTDTRFLIPALEYEVKVSDKEFERLSTKVRFDMDAIPYGYAWNFPKKNHLSVGIASARRTKINLKKYYQEYVSFLGLKDIISQSQHGFQIPVAARTDGFVKNNVFLTGDAAGFADPVTAEGISNAYSGMLAAQAIYEANLDPKEAETLYMEKLKKKLLPELKTGAWLAKFFYEQKTIRNLLLKKYGQRFSEAMADIFMGERSYPADIKKRMKQKIKELVF